MTDITPTFSQLLESHQPSAGAPKQDERPRSQLPPVDEFLKEANRINTHISSLLSYLQSIRQSYLSSAPAPLPSRRHLRRTTSSSSPVPTSSEGAPHSQSQKQHLTDQERDSIDSSTALLLRDLSSSIENLASAETLRQETQSSLLRKKYGRHLNSRLWRWAAGGGGGGGGGGDGPDYAARSPEQEAAEDSEKTIKTVRENVLWHLRRSLEEAAEAQRGMVEKRIERVKEKEKSVLHRSTAAGGEVGKRAGDMPPPPPPPRRRESSMRDDRQRSSSYASDHHPARDVSMDQDAVAEIESQLSPEQLQLFAEENDSMLKHYEDTLGKVQNAEKSLLEISSLQQTLVTHLATQEDYIGQLVADASSTHTNVGQGNKELKRASEKRSTAQMVFWGTVGLCTWLVIWDAIF